MSRRRCSTTIPGPLKGLQKMFQDRQPMDPLVPSHCLPESPECSGHLGLGKS